MNKIKTIFFGTQEFAVTILQGMIDSGIFDIDLVITQPDQPVGRKQILTPPPVKVLAEKFGLKVEQPKTLKNYELGIRNYDIGVCCQYGLIIPENILNTPKFGTLNVHTSLLPKYRGASPIQTALMNGVTETGVTIMRMDAGMDTGPILTQKTVTIDENENYTTLNEKLAKIAVLELLEAIPPYISGELLPQAQDNTKATYTKILTREDGKIDWLKSANEIYNQYRGLTPWPGVWTTRNEKRVKLLKIEPNTKYQIPDTTAQHGSWIMEQNKIFIICGNGAIEILELQLEGSKAMESKSFINGFKKYLE